MANPDTVVVFAGGPKPDADVLSSIPRGAPIVAADRGAEHALGLGLAVELAIGDFDSIRASVLAQLEAGGARVERHPAAKDLTDLALALDAAIARGPRRLLVVGGAGGRLDHELAGLLLLGADAYAQAEVDAFIGRARVHVVRRERRLSGTPGELITLLALHGDARGVVSEGLAFPLHGEVLTAGSTRGVSNVFVSHEARLRVEEGVLVAVCPGGRASISALRRALGSEPARSASS